MGGWRWSSNRLAAWKGGCGEDSPPHGGANTAERPQLSFEPLCLVGLRFATGGGLQIRRRLQACPTEQHSRKQSRVGCLVRRASRIDNPAQVDNLPHFPNRRGLRRFESLVVQAHDQQVANLSHCPTRQRSRNQIGSVVRLGAPGRLKIGRRMHPGMQSCPTFYKRAIAGNMNW